MEVWFFITILLLVMGLFTGEIESAFAIAIFWPAVVLILVFYILAIFVWFCFLIFALPVVLIKSVLAK